MKQPYAFHFEMGTCRGGMREVQGGSAASTFHLSLSTSAQQSRRAFTLIELIGVMAIIGILSAVVLPPLISKIEDANTTKEDANLEEIARALVAGIKATGTIPNPTTPNFTAGSWTAIALNYTTLGQTALASVLPANNDRQIILSANLAAYVTANGNSYATDPDGWPNPLPNDLKIYILASSKNGLPLQAGIPVADIANWTKVFNAGTGTVAVPASVFGAANTTKGEFLHVKVVDLNQLFCRVELREFPYPQNAITQTANPGAGYTTGTTYSGNIGAFSSSFIAPAPTFDTVVGTAASSIALNGTRSQITRNGATSTTMSGTIPAPAGAAGGAAANFDITINNPPWWDISPPIPVNGQQMPNNANTQPFYLIKGTSLSLYADGAALPPNSVLTVQINADITFEYFNGSWTRVD
jgi:prepilin-type N-terminal cleavage/methylation domain-containing protein